MPSTFSPSLRIELIGAGEQAGVWNDTTNTNLGSLIEQAITGVTNLDVTAGNITLTSLNGLVDEARSAVLAVTGTPGVTRVLTIPNAAKLYTVRNATANIVQVKTASGTAFDCPALSQSYIVCDGSNVVTGRSITDGANTITSNAAPFNSPTFTGVPIAPTAAPGTNTTQLATTAFVLAAFPVGGIILWSGSIASVPSGWALCNGSSGTPDLRDRFVVGAGSTYAVAATGGATTVTLDTTQIPSHTHTTSSVSTADLSHTHNGSGTSSGQSVGHTHSGTTGDQSVDHTHSGTTGNNSVDHNHGVSGTTAIQNADHGHSGATDTQGTHAHNFYSGAFGSTFNAFPNDEGGAGTVTNTYTTATAGAHNHNVSTGIQNANHEHTFSVTSAGQSTSHNHGITTGVQSTNHNHAITTGTQSTDHNHTYSFTTGAMSANSTHSHSVTLNNTGGGLSHENRPPYYALAYIMKT
jgi:microcystin-dependent protein